LLARNRQRCFAVAMRTRSLAALAMVLLLGGCATPSVEPVETSIPATDVTVTIDGGLETDPIDGGRPVVLVAAALGVPTEVFREAFSGVTPAGAGEEPDSAQVALNKQALLDVLGPYGITNDQLDAASNFYRYNGAAGEMWPNESATAVAVVENGVVTRVTITNPGYGYTSIPTVTLSNGQHATATLTYGKDTAGNGSVASISLD
jgi:hypothetical protein